MVPQFPTIRLQINRLRRDGRYWNFRSLSVGVTISSGIRPEQDARRDNSRSFSIFALRTVAVSRSQSLLPRPRFPA